MPSIVACVKDPGFIVLDGPTTDHITCQALASRRFEITFSGPGGHSWSDFGIGNPVHALSRAIALFTDDPSTGWLPRELPSTSGRSKADRASTRSRRKPGRKSIFGRRAPHVSTNWSNC